MFDTAQTASKQQIVTRFRERIPRKVVSDEDNVAGGMYF
jgi:hypothetical protein